MVAEQPINADYYSLEPVFQHQSLLTSFRFLLRWWKSLSHPPLVLESQNSL